MPMSILIRMLGGYDVIQTQDHIAEINYNKNIEPKITLRWTDLCITGELYCFFVHQSRPLLFEVIN